MNTFLKVIRADGETEQRQIAEMKARAAETAADIDRSVAAIMEDVRQNGMEAVERYSLKFDGARPYVVPEERIQQAYYACPRGLLSECMAQLHIANVNILGFVVNGAMEGSGKKYQYGGAYSRY